MASLIEGFASYVPALTLRRQATDPAPVTSPQAERLAAAVLFADVSGFTALTERLAARGPEGVEDLTHILNDYFGQVVDLIAVHGGDVVKFAGDALLVLWPAAVFDEDLATATRRAAQCGLALQEQLGNYEALPGVRFSQRVSVGAGEVVVMDVGGVFGRWESLVTGEPILQVGLAEKLAEPGEVLVAAAAAELLLDTVSGDVLPGGELRLRTVTAPIPPRSLERPHLSAEAERALLPYIPGAVRARLSAGQTHWLAELRQLTVIFVSLPDLNAKTPLEEAQRMMRTLQTVVYRYEGSINKINVDDKGVMVLAAFGLPPLAHEDDPVRGVQAALAMQAELRDLGWRSPIGVTTGRVFCGLIGSETRREYTVIGDTVNLSAR
ncbi:MAG: adenylate/guanylate cyclase domain-containing protein, partial [Chloroflexi bacterium]|nr:adenylate/guanylate cyclase domain-containing protein [Chloroflexota bacterium]